jgi:hypothetical protein
MALVFDNKIFFHIPKTGGNYVREIIYSISILPPKEKGFPHSAPLDIYKKLIKYESFCVVRHPLEWYRSIYRYYVQKKWGRGKKKITDMSMICRADTFEQYIKNILMMYKYGYATAYFSRFVPFINHIIHTENLSNELQNLLNSWGYKQKISYNKTNETIKNTDTIISEETKALLLKRENGIIKYLNY